MRMNRNPTSIELDSAYQLCSFVEASYSINVVRIYKKTADIEIEAQINFRTHSSAKPVFELGVDEGRLMENSDLLKARVNGTPTHCETVPFNGDGDIPLIALSKSLLPGLHTLKLKYKLKDMVGGAHAISVTPAGLFLRFSMSDLDSRGGQFLGQYLPSNLAFDRYMMEFDVFGEALETEYTLMTNEGMLSPGNRNHWKYKTPEYYKASYIWFHLFPAKSHVHHQKEIVIGNQTIRATVYGCVEEFDNAHPRTRISRLLALYMKRSSNYLQYFIRRYGDFPTQSLTVLMRAPSPSSNSATTPNPINMEYAGALSANIVYLKHEICHCYFGRCVSPANGDASWFDEAVASWEDRNTPALEQAPQYWGGFLACSSLDRRMITSSTAGGRVAYHEGQAVIGHLDHLLHVKGGMTEFLRYLLDKKKWMPVTNQDLADLLNDFSPQLEAGNSYIRYVNGKPPYAPYRH
jgi:hypothetical protein